MGGSPPPSTAVDGIYNGPSDTGYGNIFHTDANFAPSWWRVDFGTPRRVQRVYIRNRIDQQARLNGATIRVGNLDSFNQNTVCASLGTAALDNVVTCDIVGRFLFVVVGTVFLHFSELEAFGPCACPIDRFGPALGTAMTACVACQSGFTSPVGSVGAAACIPIVCNAGFQLSGSLCGACASGKYTAGASVPCADPPVNAFAPDTQSFLCNAGYSLPVVANACSTCASGKYTAGAGVACADPPANAFAPNTRSFLCNAGYFASASTCQACPSKSTSPVGGSNSSACQCVEGYIDTAPGANNCQPPPPHELALCAKLADATAHVLALDADKHSVANLHEANCVRIDPCTQQTKQGAAAAAGEWHHVADLGLQFASPGGAHANANALEYARVPQGIVLQTCPPDFAHYRATGTWRCNADPATLVRIQGACPSLLPHTILDCLAPTQFDAGSDMLLM